MEEPDMTQSFADHLVAAQVKLYSYILTLMPWPDQASDVLQRRTSCFGVKRRSSPRGRTFWLGPVASPTFRC